MGLSTRDVPHDHGVVFPVDITGLNIGQLT